MKISEVITNSTDVYRWVDDTKFKKYIDRHVIPADWTHFIESENRMIKGSSWSHDLYKWSLDFAFCINVDLSKVIQEYYEINGQRTYLHTKALKDPIFDPNAYKLEDGPNDEVFIEGIISFKPPIVTKVLIRSWKIFSTTNEDEIKNKMKNIGIEWEYLK
jgi:hypothetical protein